MTIMKPQYHETDAPYERFGELSVQDLIDLLNRRVKFHARAQEVKDNANEYHYQAERECHHLLDRITAHKMNIRAITND